MSRVIFPLITAPYVSRVLEPDGVGLFNFSNTYAAWFSMFAALGIPYYGIREIARLEDKQEQQRFVSEIISISMVSTLLCSAMMFLTLFFIPQLNENYVIFLVAGTVLYITPFKIDWYFRGMEEFGYITFRSLLIKILSVILLFLFVRSKSDLLLYVFLNAISLVLNEVWNFVKLYQRGLHPCFTLSGRKHIKSLLVLFSSSIAISVYTLLDTLMLGFMTDYAEVGYYNCATHISRALLPVVTSLSAVVLPRISLLEKSNDLQQINKLINKSFSVIAFLSFPVAFIVIAVAPTFIPLFYGEQFYGATLPLQIMILTVIAIGFNNLTGFQILLALGFDKLFLYSILIGMVSNFSLNLLFIPYFGASGAALSSVIAEFLILAVMIYYIYTYTKIRFRGERQLLQAFIFSSLFFLVAFLIGQFISGWPFVFVSGIVCSLIYLLFQNAIGNESLLVFKRIVIEKITTHKLL